MDEASAEHLTKLAWAAVRAVNPLYQDREDYFQHAYLKGLECRSEAEQAKRQVSNRLLFKRMRDRLFRYAKANAKQKHNELDEVAAPPSAAVNADERELVRARLHQLTRDERSAVMLHYVQGLSFTEMAQAQKTTRTAAFNMVRNAVKRLRGCTDADE